MYAFYCILIAIFCAIPAQFAIADSETPVENLCEGLLARRVLISRFYLNSHAFYRDEFYNITTWKPSSGPGQLIAIDVVELHEHWPTLFKVARRYPEYFAQFDIYANEKRLIIPDSTRLNTRTKNGVRFKDLFRFFPWSSHFYTNEYFDRNFEKGLIVLASRSSYFYHDRMQEHMMGALILPAWLYEKFVAYAKFKKLVLQMKQQKTDKKLKDFIGYESGPTTTSAHYWDDLTGRIGRMVEEMARHGGVLPEDILKLRDIFLDAGVGFTPGLESYIGRNLVYGWRFESDKGAPILAEVERIAAQFPTETITTEKALREAIRVVHELTKIPEQQLRQMVEK